VGVSPAHNKTQKDIYPLPDLPFSALMSWSCMIVVWVGAWTWIKDCTLPLWGGVRGENESTPQTLSLLTQTITCHNTG